jgi:hypothetical protein
VPSGSTSFPKIARRLRPSSVDNGGTGRFRYHPAFVSPPLDK